MSNSKKDFSDKSLAEIELEQNEARTIVRKAVEEGIEDLSSSSQKIIHLRYYAGYGFDTIVDYLNIEKADGIKAKIDNSLIQLREFLNSTYDLNTTKSEIDSLLTSIGVQYRIKKHNLSHDEPAQSEIEVNQEEYATSDRKNVRTFIKTTIKEEDQVQLKQDSNQEEKTFIAFFALLSALHHQTKKMYYSRRLRSSSAERQGEETGDNLSNLSSNIVDMLEEGEPYHYNLEFEDNYKIRIGYKKDESMLVFFDFGGSKRTDESKEEQFVIQFSKEEEQPQTFQTENQEIRVRRDEFIKFLEDGYEFEIGVKKLID